MIRELKGIAVSLVRLLKTLPLFGIRSWKMSRFPAIRLKIERELLPGLDLGTTARSPSRTQRLEALPGNIAPFKDVMFLPPPLFDPPPRGVEIFKSARLVGKNVIALTNSGKMIQEALFRTSGRNDLALSYLRLDEVSGLRKSPRPRNNFLDGKVCLLTSFWDSFGHWIPEHLLKIKLLRDSGEDTSAIRFLIRDPVEEFKIFLLKAAGIEERQIIPWHGQLTSVEELVVPSYPQISDENLAWVSSLVPPPLRGFEKPRRPILYLSRQKQPYRRILNEDNVQDVLQGFGAVTLYPEDYPFEEQVAFVRSTSILFGPQGSAFTLQIFMQPGTLVEAFPRDRVHLFNRQVAGVMGHKHFPLMDSRGPQAKGFQDKTVMVDSRLLKEILSWAVSEP